MGKEEVPVIVYCEAFNILSDEPQSTGFELESI
jgi:hypothetical protein